LEWGTASQDPAGPIWVIVWGMAVPDSRRITVFALGGALGTFLLTNSGSEQRIPEDSSAPWLGELASFKPRPSRWTRGERRSKRARAPKPANLRVCCAAAALLNRETVPDRA